MCLTLPAQSNIRSKSLTNCYCSDVTFELCNVFRFAGTVEEHFGWLTVCLKNIHSFSIRTWYLPPCNLQCFWGTLWLCFLWMEKVLEQTQWGWPSAILASKPKNILALMQIKLFPLTVALFKDFWLIKSVPYDDCSWIHTSFISRLRCAFSK